MQITRLTAVGSDYEYEWLGGDVEPYSNWVEYEGSCQNSALSLDLWH